MRATDDPLRALFVLKNHPLVYLGGFLVKKNVLSIKVYPVHYRLSNGSGLRLGCCKSTL